MYYPTTHPLNNHQIPAKMQIHILITPIFCNSTQYMQNLSTNGVEAIILTGGLTVVSSLLYRGNKASAPRLDPEAVHLGPLALQ
jgi:hypothetical protein